jgi:hypothetical protein
MVGRQRCTFSTYDRRDDVSASGAVKVPNAKRIVLRLRDRALAVDSRSDLKLSDDNDSGSKDQSIWAASQAAQWIFQQQSPLICAGYFTQSISKKDYLLSPRVRLLWLIATKLERGPSRKGTENGLG